MDSDGFTVQGRRRGGTIRAARDRDQASFHRDTPRYKGTSDECDRAHARRYGKEEGPRGATQFPRGSERQKLHSQYSASTKARDNTRSAYQKSLGDAEYEFSNMGQDQQEYYDRHSGGLAPDQHERLDPRAGAYRDKCYRYATSIDHSEDMLIMI